MKHTSINSYDIIQLSAGDMAEYFAKALNNPAVKNMLNAAPNLNRALTDFKQFGNMLQAYVVATGDTSQEMVEKMAQDYSLHSDKFIVTDRRSKLEGKQVYFEDCVMPQIIAHHAQRYNMQEPLQLDEMIKILTSVKMNGEANRFETHSFNGALVDDIRENGFDITKEKFKEEYTALTQAGIMTSYQKGNLLTCDLSADTFSYAYYTPERLYQSLSKNKPQEDAQSVNEFYQEALVATVAAKNLPQARQQQVLEAGKKIIDFYFGSHKTSAIAFIGKSKDVGEVTTAYHLADFRSALLNSDLTRNISRFCDSNAHPDLKAEFESARNALLKDDFSQMQECIAAFNRDFPENKLFDDACKRGMMQSLTQSCIPNFMFTNADGYIIPDGKLAPKEFSVAVIPNIAEMYPENKKAQNRAVAKENLIIEEYKHSLYEKKHLLEIKKGIKPKESFEEFCTSTPIATHHLTSDKRNALRVENPAYTAWKRLHGYNNPKSPQSLTIEEKITRQSQTADTNRTPPFTPTRSARE